MPQVELHRLRMPLVSPFRTSFGEQTSRDVVLVRWIDGDSVGWSELVALETPVYSPEYVEGAVDVIRRHLLPRIATLGGPFTATRAARAMAPVKGHPMAKAALETAILDAELRRAGVSLADHLGAVRETVVAGVSVGIMNSIPQLIDTVSGYLAEGYRRIKLKIEPGWDVEPVRAVREKFGDILLQVDANTAYTLGDAQLLAKLDPFDLLLIEQPLEEDDIVGHADLAKLIRTPVCLDESITSARSAAAAIRLGACAIVNVKPGRVGGYLESRRIHDVCAAHGIPVWCGGMLETGVGRAANLALAALPGFTLPGDTSASNRYYKTDVVDEPAVLEADGSVRVPQRPGIGVEIVDDAVAELRYDLQTLTT